MAAAFIRVTSPYELASHMWGREAHFVEPPSIRVA